MYVCVREKENKLMVSASLGRKVIVLYGNFFLSTIQEMSTLITLKKSKHATLAHEHNSHARQVSAMPVWHMLPYSMNKVSSAIRRKCQYIQSK